MPIKYEIDKSKGVIFTTASGKLKDDDIIQLKLRLNHDPYYTPGMKELSDIRLVDQFEVTQAGVMEFVTIDEVYAEKLKDYKLAIVVPHAEAQGLANIYQIMTKINKANVKAFRELEEAKKWLGI